MVCAQNYQINNFLWANVCFERYGKKNVTQDFVTSHEIATLSYLQYYISKHFIFPRIKLFWFMSRLWLWMDHEIAISNALVFCEFGR